MTTTDVLQSGNGLKVSRIDAMANAAKVVQFMSRGNRADKGLVGPAVAANQDGSSLDARQSERCVAHVSSGPGPEPTTICPINLRPKPLALGRNLTWARGKRIAVLPPAEVMHVAEPSRLGWVRAAFNGAHIDSISKVAK